MPGSHPSFATACEHLFDAQSDNYGPMTSQGSAYSRFKRALATGNPLLIRSTAAELGRIELHDALAICLALAAVDDDAYGRAAARFAARWSVELPGVTLEETQALAAAMQALRLPETAAMGHHLLTALVETRGLERMERALVEHGVGGRGSAPYSAGSAGSGRRRP